MKQTKKVKKEKITELEAIHKAVRMLGEFMEDPMHDQYRILYMVDAILAEASSKGKGKKAK